MLYHIFKIKADLIQKNRVADQLMSRDEDQETEDLEFDPVLQPDEDLLDICVAYLDVETLYMKQDLDEDEFMVSDRCNWSEKDHLFALNLSRWQQLMMTPLKMIQTWSMMRVLLGILARNGCW